MAYTDIDKPTDYFNTILWTGDNTNRTISGVGFQPDWIWWKQRNGTDDHRLLDSVRGEGIASYKLLFSSGNYAEFDGSDNGGSQGNINAITSDGFSGIQGTVGWNNWNGTGLNYVGWNWLAGGTASSNTDGSITSTVSANTTSGFSIVSYTGTGSNATVGHGLSSVPKMIIVKDRSATNNWTVYHVGVGNDKDILLDVTNAENTSTAWNNTTPTSSVFSIGTLGNVNTSSNNYIAYCFAEKKGYSKFGSYTGNGNSDGTFVYTGFKPAWVLIKPSSTTGSWYLFDSTRNSFNVTNSRLKVDGNEAESSNIDTLDIISNGFKLRDTNAAWNGSGTTYIYMCFAESPFTTSTGIPTTAR